MKFSKSLCIIWASSRENLSSVVFEQQRRRPACASTQSDQRLCYSLFEITISKLATSDNFDFIASLCSCGDLFESHFVGDPEDRFSRDEAHMRLFHHGTLQIISSDTWTPVLPVDHDSH